MYQLTYWNNKGKYQAILDAITEALVPNEGPAKNVSGEICRLLGNVYYERFNNGGSFYGGQRGSDARKLVKLVKGLPTPKLDDEEAWDAMADKAVLTAWTELAKDPESLKLVRAAFK